MKARILSTPLLALVTCICLTAAIALLGYDATAQAPGAPTARGGERIAVIDIKYILDHHNRYKYDKQQLTKKFQAASQKLQTERDAIIGLEKKLLTFKVGMPEYNRTDEEITQRKALWGVEANKQKKEIRNSQAQILWNVYHEIKLETKRYCDRNRIGIVLQFNGDKINNSNAGEVIQGITRPIVYNSQNLDITPYILQPLNRVAAPGGPAAAVNPRGNTARGNSRVGVPLK